MLSSHGQAATGRNRTTLFDRAVQPAANNRSAYFCLAMAAEQKKTM